MVPTPKRNRNNCQFLKNICVEGSCATFLAKNTDNNPSNASVISTLGSSRSSPNRTNSIISELVLMIITRDHLRSPAVKDGQKYLKEPLTGLEPATCSLRMSCSAN